MQTISSYSCNTPHVYCMCNRNKLVTKANVSQISDVNPTIQPDYCFQVHNLKIWIQIWSSLFSLLLLT